MSHQQFAPADLIRQTSQQLAGTPALNRFQSILQPVAQHLGGHLVEVTLRTPEGAQRWSLGESHVAAVFSISQSIRVRGVEYGHLHFESRQPLLPAGELLLTLETLAAQFGLYAERLHLLSERERLQMEIAEAREQTQQLKILAKAIGLLTSEQTPAEAARRRIEQEARRQKSTPAAIAERLLLEAHMSRVFSQSAPEGARRAG